MTKLLRTQLLHKLAEDNLRGISLYEYFKTLKCDCELIQLRIMFIGAIKVHHHLLKSLKDGLEIIGK